MFVLNARCHSFPSCNDSGRLLKLLTNSEQNLRFDLFLPLSQILRAETKKREHF